MDANDLRAIFTVVALCVFLAIVVWAYSGRNRQRFDEAAQLPFTEDEDVTIGVHDADHHDKEKS